MSTPKYITAISDKTITHDAVPGLLATVDRNIEPRL